MANPVLTKQFGTEKDTKGGSAPVVDGGDTMTMSSVLGQTGLLFVLLIGAATFGWTQATVDNLGPIFWGSLVVTIILLVATVVRPQWVRFTAPLYALAEGVLVGVISKTYSDIYDGIVVQAVLATFAVFVAMLILYANRIIKVTQRLRSTIILATVGVFAFYLISIGLSFLGVSIPFVWDGGPFSILISVLIVGIAAFNLLLDFDTIERGINNQAPGWMSWFAAFGLMVTLVWLYLEILRLLALTRD
ncbi:MAG: Bax inhibitor-1/YccA family protein [Acidimicrobiia bacterium]